MAGNEGFAKPGANEFSADDPAGDLKSLLDSLAREIKGAGARHTEALHGMQGRVAALSDRASAAKPNIPHEYGAAIDRIEAAMSSFSERLTDAEPQQHREMRPVDEADSALPGTVRAEVRHAILNAHREADDVPPAPRSALIDFGGSEFGPQPAAGQNAFGESGEEVLAPPSAADRQATAPSASATATIEPSWLEARFADIANRVEQSLAAHGPHNTLLAIGARFDQLEQRFDRTLEEITTRPGTDPENLKAVERQITELFTHLDRTHSQLGRLDAIETRLTDLRQSLSDEHMATLFATHAPTDEKLSAIATAAAERVAASIRSDMAVAPAAPVLSSDPRLVELTAMLDAFIGEQRQGDAQTAEALDTMQQAMQHLIDRVEVIETTQVTNHEALMRTGERPPTPPQESHIFAVRSPEPARAELPDAFDPPAPDLDAALDSLPPVVSSEMASMPHGPRADAHRLPSGALLPSGELDRQALIAMARRAAEKVSSETTDDDHAPAMRTIRRPAILLIASLAAFLLAGLWLIAGPSLRGLIPNFGLGAARSIDEIPATDAPARAAVEKQQDKLAGPDTTGRVVESGDATTGDEDGPSEEVRLASLSARVAPGDLARAAPATASTADLMAALGHDTRAPSAAAPSGAGEMPTMSRSVEMPPAMLGPLSLRHAASKGDPRAQFEVAARFAEGKGVPQDFGQAATWYQRAATQGLAAAQYRLGALYERGLGVTADTARARVWYKRAAEQGNLRAMHNLAVLSAGRPGMSPDYPSAVQWFTEAANRGLADSQYNLGILYESGLGVPANNIEAYKWYSLAARSGDKDATRRRDSVRTKLDRNNMRAADSLVIQWRAKAVEPAVNESGFPGQGWQAVRR